MPKTYIKKKKYRDEGSFVTFFFFQCIFLAFCAFIDRRETVDRLVKGGERVGEDTLQTGHRWDSNLDRQKHVHGVPGC